MKPENCSIAVCDWPGDKRWVYSISFDEALADLHRFTVPILQQYGVPGHVEVVGSQIGQVRRLGNSSYNGMRHMNAGELRELLARGWGVGNHSWSHEVIDEASVEREIGEAKKTLENAMGETVTIYCSPGDNTNMSRHVLDACRRHGYLGAMSITDDLNRPDAEDLLWLNRTYLHEQGYPPFSSAFDPFRRLHHARRDRGWVIDYLHCPLEQAVHPNKDCSAAHLRERIETVVAVGGSDVWLARVEDAADYRFARRHLQIASAGPGQFELSAPGLPAAVRRRFVTLKLPPEAVAVEMDGRLLPMEKSGLLDVDVSQPRRLKVAGGR